MSLIPEKPVLTTSEVAAIWQIKPAQVTKWVAAGYIPRPCNHGAYRCLRWKRSDVIRFLELRHRG